MASVRRINHAKSILIGGGILFLLSVAVFAYTNLYLVLAIPFIALIFGLAILNVKAFYWFLLFTIPFSATIYFFSNTFSTTVPDEPLTWMLLLITIFLAIYHYKRFPEWFFRNPITFVIALQLLWMMVAVVFSKDFFLSAKYAAAKIWFINAYFLFPVLVFKKPKDLKKAFLVLFIPITLHAIFVFCWHYTLNFDYWLSNMVVHPFYYNHVDYSTVLSMLFPLLLTSWRLSKGKKWLRVLIVLGVLFYIAAILASQARAAILAVAFAIFMAFMIRKKWVNIVMPTGYAIILVVVLFLAHDNFYIQLRPNKRFTATQPTFMDAVKGMFTGTDMSSMERFYRWIAAVRMSTANPVTGVGPNNFYYYYKPYTVSMFATWVSRNKQESTTHNYFLFMLVEQGYPAMILYAILIFLIFARAQKIFHRTDNKFYKDVVIGLAMVVAAGFVNNFFSELIDTHKVGALFYISISSIVILDRFTLKEQKERSLKESTKEHDNILSDDTED